MTYFELIEAECAKAADQDPVVAKNVMFRDTLHGETFNLKNWRSRKALFRNRIGDQTLIEHS